MRGHFACLHASERSGSSHRMQLTTYVSHKRVSGAGRDVSRSCYPSTVSYGVVTAVLDGNSLGSGALLCGEQGAVTVDTYEHGRA